MFAILKSLPKSHRHAGFTLVELSIVLVILGLLVGGVLAGQSLIRASELRSVITQYNGYQTAVNSFKDKYFAIPGDMTNAQSFWGVAHATPATCVTTVGTGTQTCNGDGNGNINDVTAEANEDFRFWQHLANAGLIQGNYSGITQGSSSVAATNVNAPSGKIGGSLWFAHYWGNVSSIGFLFDGTYNNFLEFGATLANSDPQSSLLKPEELWNIDTKMDDGKPATGKLMARLTASCTDALTGSNLSANYLLNSNTVSCIAIFPRAF